jgi:hypothetical protein
MAADPIKMVFDLLIQGQGTAEILQLLQDDPHTAADAGLIVEQALSNFLKAAKLPRAVRRGWCIEALRNLYYKLLAAGDHAGAIRAVKEIATLSRLYDQGDGGEAREEINEFIDNVMSL